MIRECSGIVCLCLTSENADHSVLHQMVDDNTSKNQTAFTISIEAKEGVTTSLGSRQDTNDKTAIAQDAKPEDLSHRDMFSPKPKITAF